MSQHLDAMRSGEWYLDGPHLEELRRECWRLLDVFNGAGADEDGVRRDALTHLVAEVGDGAVVMPRLQCSYGSGITLGERSFVNSNALLMDDAAIVIGADARIGPGAQFLTALHPVEDHDARRDGWERAAPISVGDNVWLGAGVLVCPGVTIGADTVVGAGSVVVHDLPARVFAVGSPAAPIRRLDPAAGG